MFCIYFISILLFISSFGELGISLFEHKPSLKPKDKNCPIKGEITITPNYLSFIDGYKVTPCVWGDFENGMELRYVWIQADNNKILIDDTETYNDKTINKRILGIKQSYFRIWRNILPTSSGDFKVPIRVELYANGKLEDTVDMTVIRPEQQIGYDSNLFAIKTNSPKNWEDCKLDSNENDIKSILSNGGTLYICVIYKLPICPNKNISDDSLKTTFSISVTGEISGNLGEYSIEYPIGFNTKLKESFYSINVSPGESSLFVTAKMNSYGKDFSESKEISF